MIRRPLLGRLNHLALVGDRWFISALRVLNGAGSRVSRAASSGRARVRLPFLSVHDESPVPEARARETTCVAEELDLLAAAGFEEFGPGPAASVLVREPAGVVPLWRALGRVVSQHAESGYRSLETDGRFWALVRLIQSCMAERAEATNAPERGLAQHCD